MRVVMLLGGLLLSLYVVAAWIGGTLQYSFEGYIGSGIYGIGNYFDAGFMSRGTFMSIVYVLTLLLGIIMIIAGFGDRKKGE